MIINLLLITIFLVSVGALLHLISERVPQLAAVSDHAVMQILEQDSNKIRLFFLPLRLFYTEKHYKHIFWNVVGKVFYRFHLFLMRFDNALVSALKQMQQYAGHYETKSKGDYWKELQRERVEKNPQKSVRHSKLLEEVNIRK